MWKSNRTHIILIVKPNMVSRKASGRVLEQAHALVVFSDCYARRKKAWTTRPPMGEEAAATSAPTIPLAPFEDSDEIGPVGD